jgi:hypothetical protein
LADSIDRYLAHKRSLGKQLDSAGLMLHVLDNYLNTQEIVEAPPDYLCPPRRVCSLTPSKLCAQLQRTHWNDTRIDELDGGSRTAARVAAKV